MSSLDRKNFTPNFFNKIFKNYDFLKFHNSLHNESGFVLVLSMLILIVLVIIGLSSSKTSTVELQIAGNEKVAKQLFYLTESGVYEYAQAIDNEDNSTRLNLYGGSSIDYETPSTWPSDYTSNSTLTNSTYTLKSVAADTGVDSGSSLDVTESRVHNLKIISHAEFNSGQGEKVIGIGFKKRY